MRSLFVLLCLLTIAACGTSEYQRAEDRLVFLEKNGADTDELCQAARAVTEAAVAERRNTEYQTASLKAAAACQKAALERE